MQSEIEHHAAVVAENRRQQDEIALLRAALESIVLLKHDRYLPTWRKCELADLYAQRALAESVGRQV